jgi:methionyl-tRNA formyltransferase
MKLILFADNKVGSEVLNYFLGHFREDLYTVVTVEENQIYKQAKLNGLQVEVFDKNNNQNEFYNKKFELGVLAWWPQIIKEPLLSLPQKGFINFHPSFLPYNRGKHYNFWALVEQCPFGVSLHKVDAGIDTGGIVSQRLLSYNWEDNGETLYKKAQTEIVELFKSIYPSLRKGEIASISQDLSKGSFRLSSEIDKASEIKIDDTYIARELLNLIRARTFEGHPSCWFEEIDGEKYEVRIQIKRKD